MTETTTDLFITVPETVEFTADYSFSFVEFCTYLLDSDDVFNVHGKAIRAGCRVERALEGLKVGDELQLSPGDRKLLYEAAENPTQGYPDLIGTDVTGAAQKRSMGRALLPYLGAIENAAPAAAA